MCSRIAPSFPDSLKSLSVYVLLVRASGVLRSLQLHLQTLHAYLEAVHRLYGSGGGGRIVVGDEAWDVRSSASERKHCSFTKTFALICRAINENLRRNYCAEWHEHLHEFGVAELLRQMVDEEIAACKIALFLLSTRCRSKVISQNEHKCIYFLRSLLLVFSVL